MTEEILDGTEVLEKLAEIDLLDDFWEAIDTDNFSLALQLMSRVGIDDEMKHWVVSRMKNPWIPDLVKYLQLTDVKC